ncbi:hypothetical protein DF16_pBMB293orf00180 (plasmid) [Bacillus thuringiensis serovar kurstaki str. YBT-1520]|nr:hypothetical protein H175_285p252 [Bacillus thuringiensis serovar thuringiensis str. IS5056]AIM34704.1 hypothetical protein DF16_pBMB293orf00180 [Bacillus thuringiensis serovar kurstaki str. YBT-1520]KEH45609.1 hypothetical protein BG09_5693 [Bacillus thuringiensis serovar kurstaki str. HD-1]
MYNLNRIKDIKNIQSKVNTINKVMEMNYFLDILIHFYKMT